MTFEEQPGDALHEVGGVTGHTGAAPTMCIGNGRNGDLVEFRDRIVDGGKVAAHHFVAALAPGGCCGFFHACERVINGQHVAQREEAGLHDRVDPASEAVFLGEAVGVDHEQAAATLDEQLLCFVGQCRPHLVRRARSVQEHRCSMVGAGEHVETIEEAWVVDRHEPGALDEIGGADR